MDYLFLTDASACQHPGALCFPDVSLSTVDIDVACNKGTFSMGLWVWEFPHVCGTISYEHPWEVIPNIQVYRDPEKMKKICGQGRISG